MWVRPQCHGWFRCDGFELQCRMRLERHGVHNCTCFEYEALRSDGTLARGLVPDSISGSRLVERSIFEPRFVPNATDEILHATFTLWNLLDRIMLEHSHSNYQTGYLREVQLRRMVSLVRSTRARTYCEGMLLPIELGT
jgi:hypothetical protein